MRNTEDKQFEELLGKAFREQYKNELDSGPTDEELSAMYPFTQKHTKKAEELDRKNKKRMPFYVRLLGRVAAVILCIAMAAGVITMTDPTIRGQVSHAVTHWIDEFISVDFSDAEADDRIDITKTSITYLPEGFSLAEENSDQDTISRIYENSVGEYIIIDIEQSCDIKLMTDAGTHETELYPINDYEGYISYSEELNQGSIYFGSSYFTVAISGMTERGELIKIAENIELKD